MRRRGAPRTGSTTSNRSQRLGRRGPNLTGLELRSLVSRLILLVAASVVVAAGIVSTPAAAHSGKQSYLYISLFDDGVEGRVEIPVVDLGPALGIDLANSSGGLRVGVAASSTEIVEYVDEHTSLSGAGEPWSIEFGQPRVLGTENGPYVVTPYVVTDTFDAAPQEFTAEFDAIIEADPEKDALLLVEDNWRSATFDNGSNPLLGFSTGATVQQVVLDDAGTLTSMAEIRGLGSDAVRNGIVIMLVVAALVLSVVLLPAQRSRSEIATTGELIRRGGRIAGPFAAAVVVGSLLSGPGALDLPNRLVGIVISATLGALAVYAVVARYRPEFRPAGWLLATIAGSVVGLELGRLFVFYGLDRTRPLVGWIAFVVGALIAMALAAVFVGTTLYLLRRTRYAPAVLVILAVVLGAYGIAWTGELLLDTDWPIEEVANPFRVWPRNAWFVLLAVAAAAGVRAIESRAGRLLPVGSMSDDADVTSADPLAVG